jgi:predicted nucleic acid-binding protein
VKNRIYIETTIVSYLTASPSKDVILLAQQRLTCEWWVEHRHRYELYTSRFVVDEAGDGNPDAARKRLEALKELLEVPVTDESLALAKSIVDEGLLPSRAGTDAMHLAIATVYDMDILLTWNCRHLAIPDILVQIGRFLRKKGYQLPLVITPFDMMGGSEGL